jgi:cytosine/adenosine deaminase-related metal-dependent hydrolase
VTDLAKPGDLVLRDVRIWPRDLSEKAVDVLVRAGRVAAVGRGLEVPPSTPAADGRGGVLLPALADVHAHLDSTRLGLPFRPHTAEPGLAGLVENDRRSWRQAERGVAERATFTLGRTIASGATRVRSHAQVDTDSGLERLEGVLAAREAHAARAHVEVVAFPQRGILRDPGTADLLEQALLAGADLVGGLDPCAFDRDPVAHLDVVLGLAERHGRGVDVHLHETGELGAFTIELLCERVAALGMQGRATVSHAFALSSVDPDRQAALVDLLAEHDVAVTTVAPGVREPLPLERLRAAGVRVGLGQDGIRDYWSPYGDGDVLGRAWQLAFRAGYRRDDLVESCVEVASLGGAAVLGEPLPGRGLEVGAPADLVVVPGDTVTAAVMDRSPRTLVVRSGRVVAADGELVDA